VRTRETPAADNQRQWGRATRRRARFSRARSSATRESACWTPA